jgi:hypothetical protein
MGRYRIKKRGRNKKGTRDTGISGQWIWIRWKRAGRGGVVRKVIL